MIDKCQLCGISVELTSEHLPQKSLYPKEIRSEIVNFNTVRACYECNNGAKLSDEFSKVVFGLVAQAPWVKEVRKSVEATLAKNKRLDRYVSDNTEEGVVTFDDGNTRAAKKITISNEHTLELVSSVERMVKAFYFKNYGDILIESYEVSVFHPDAVSESLKKEIDGQRKVAEIHTVNSETVSYTFLNVQKTDIVSIVNLFGNIELFFVLKELGWREKS